MFLSGYMDRRPSKLLDVDIKIICLIIPPATSPQRHHCILHKSIGPTKLMSAYFSLKFYLSSSMVFQDNVFNALKYLNTEEKPFYFILIFYPQNYASWKF